MHDDPTVPEKSLGSGPCGSVDQQPLPFGLNRLAPVSEVFELAGMEEFEWPTVEDALVKAHHFLEAQIE